MTSRELTQWNHNWFGVWREDAYFTHCPAIEDCIDLSQKLPDEQQILSFLRSAPVVEAYGAVFKCKLCDLLLPVGIRSDGILAWPLDLDHYISSHGVVLPPRFISHIRNINYLAPPPSGVLRENLDWPSPHGDREGQKAGESKSK